MKTTEITPEQIKKIRRFLGLTQKTLAEKLGCSVYAVSHWERGERRPSEIYKTRLQNMVVK